MNRKDSKSTVNDMTFDNKEVKPGFHVVVSVVSVVSVLSKKSYDRYNHMETSHTTAQYDRYDRYNMFSEIEMILSPTTDITGNGRDTTAFVNGNHRKRLIRQIQQKCVPECTSFCRCYGSRSNRYDRYNNMETQDT